MQILTLANDREIVAYIEILALSNDENLHSQNLLVVQIFALGKLRHNLNMF